MGRVQIVDQYYGMVRDSKRLGENYKRRKGGRFKRNKKVCYILVMFALLTLYVFCLHVLIEMTGSSKDDASYDDNDDNIRYRYIAYHEEYERDNGRRGDEKVFNPGQYDDYHIKDEGDKRDVQRPSPERKVDTTVTPADYYEEEDEIENKQVKEEHIDQVKNPEAAEEGPEPIRQNMQIRNGRFMSFTETSQPFEVGGNMFKSMGLPLNNYVDSSNDEVLNSFQFVMGISANHAHELHAIKSIQIHFPDKLIYVFNLGLEDTYDLINSFPHVRMRAFNFTAYPEHVSQLETYAFKPIIIHEMLKELSGVFWIDTSIKFLKNQKQEWFDIVKKTDGYMAFCSSGHSVFYATHPDMYRYFSISLETAKNISAIQAGGQLIYRTYKASTHYLLWYVLCALDPQCIAPLQTTMACVAHGDRWKKYGDCHRYDQSAASILYYLISGRDKDEFCIPGGHVDVLRDGGRALDDYVGHALFEQEDENNSDKPKQNPSQEKRISREQEIVKKEDCWKLNKGYLSILACEFMRPNWFLILVVSMFYVTYGFMLYVLFDWYCT